MPLKRRQKPEHHKLCHFCKQKSVFTLLINARSNQILHNSFNNFKLEDRKENLSNEISKTLIVL